MSVADFMGGGVEVFQPPQPGSTAWMDGARTVEDMIMRNKLVIWCAACNSWYHFERDPNSKHMLASQGITCDCGSDSGFVTSSIISERTWTPNKVPPKVHKKRR